MQHVTVSSTKRREVIDITEQVEQKLSGETGVCHLSLTHTTAALSTADLDPGGTDQDYLDAFDEVVPRAPKSGQYRHPHDPSHMQDHILSSLIGTSLAVPVENGKLVLGTWQRVVLFEFNGPRERTIMVNITQMA